MHTNIKTQPKVGAYEVYDGADFFNAFCDDISKVENEGAVSVCCMSFEPQEPITSEVVKELSGAALRGANVSLVLDAYTLMNPQSIGPLKTPFPIGREARSRRTDALGSLAQDGVKCNLINRLQAPFASVVKGRSHIKLFTANSRIYLGGPNLEGTARSDIVVGFEDKETAEWLHAMTANLAESESMQSVLGKIDYERNLDDKTRILVDVGVRNQSLIMEQAVDLIDHEEERIVIGSQWFPVGAVAERLLAAHKNGVAVSVVGNHPLRQGSAMAPAHYCLQSLQRLRGYPRNFFSDRTTLTLPKVHSTALAGSKTAMVTGHNFVETGVRLGTAEIALVREDEEFASRVAGILLSQTNVRLD